jgi:hypothetical protein
MASYALGATLMLACLRSQRAHLRLPGTASLAIASLALAGCLQAFAKPESADYLRVALTRTYWFSAQWAWYELLGLAAPLVILAIFAWGEWRHTAPRNSQSPSHSLAQMAIAVGATAALATVLFSRVGAATHLVARMQPLRAFQIVYLVMVLMLGAKLGTRVLDRSGWRWCVAIALLGGIMFATSRSAYPDSSHIEFPWTAPRNPWVQAFLWIRDNTPKDAFFALDADYINAPGEDAQCFRAIAERSALPDYSKDGGEASIAPDLTPAWKTGQSAQQRLSSPSMTDAQRLSVLIPLGVSWVVLQPSANTNLDCPYKNSAVSVCRLR